MQDKLTKNPRGKIPRYNVMRSILREGRLKREEKCLTARLIVSL
ncbi:MAG: hypothetical protein QXX56_03565 [Candidatus Bathyarchaeia archaeon]